MTTIWKFELELKESQEIKLPSPARILSCQFQHGLLMLWAVVNPDLPMHRRTVYIVGTGHPIPNVVPIDYVGTVQQGEGRFIWHVFAEVR